MTQSRFNAFSLSLAKAGHRGVATLAGLALMLAAAGCGGGGRLSKAAYEARIAQDLKEISAIVATLSKSGTSLTVLASELKAAQTTLRAAAKDLQGLKPPKEVAHDNELLAVGLRGLAADFEPIRQSAMKHDRSRVQQEESLLLGSKALAQTKHATDDMRRKGYKLQNSGS